MLDSAFSTPPHLLVSNPDPAGFRVLVMQYIQRYGKGGVCMGSRLLIFK